MCVAASSVAGTSSESASAQVADHAAATTTPPAGLLGSYTTTITGNEHFHVQGASRLSAGTPSTGKWKLTLSRTSLTYTGPANGFHVTLKVVYGPGRITVPASRGCDVNLSPETKGEYTYRLVGSQLSFREIHDSCVDRAGVFTGETWHRR